MVIRTCLVWVVLICSLSLGCLPHYTAIPVPSFPTTLAPDGQVLVLGRFVRDEAELEKLLGPRIARNKSILPISVKILNGRKEALTLSSQAFSFMAREASGPSAPLGKEDAYRAGRFSYVRPVLLSLAAAIPTTFFLSVAMGLENPNPPSGMTIVAEGVLAGIASQAGLFITTAVANRHIKADYTEKLFQNIKLESGESRTGMLLFPVDRNAQGLLTVRTHGESETQIVVFEGEVDVQVPDSVSGNSGVLHRGTSR